MCVDEIQKSLHLTMPLLNPLYLLKAQDRTLRKPLILVTFKEYFPAVNIALFDIRIGGSTQRCWAYVAHAKYHKFEKCFDHFVEKL